MPEGRRDPKHEISYLLNKGGSQGSDNESTSSAYRREVPAAAGAGSRRRRRREPGELTAAVPVAKVPRTSAAASSSGAAVSSGSNVQSEKTLLDDKLKVTQLPEFREFLGNETRGSKLLNNLNLIGSRKSKAFDKKTLDEFYLNKSDYYPAKQLYEKHFNGEAMQFIRYAVAYRFAVNNENGRRRKRQRQAGKTRKGLSGNNR